MAQGQKHPERLERLHAHAAGLVELAKKGVAQGRMACHEVAPLARGIARIELHKDEDGMALRERILVVAIMTVIIILAGIVLLLSHHPPMELISPCYLMHQS